MSTKPETFASLMKQFEYSYDPFTVFDDFLTLSICACGRNPETGLSYDEALYLATIDKYKHDEVRFAFPKLFAVLVTEMEIRMDSTEGYDVLGEYYEENLSKRYKGQYFTPWLICTAMSKMTIDAFKDQEEPLRILDPCCGSGRLLLTTSGETNPMQHFYGIDIDHTCVKMAALNFFFSGMFHSEVMWADALRPDDFRMSYRISFLPFGIFRIQEKERSMLWHMHQNSSKKEHKPVVPFEEWGAKGKKNAAGDQLKLF